MKEQLHWRTYKSLKELKEIVSKNGWQLHWGKWLTFSISKEMEDGSIKYEYYEIDSYNNIVFKREEIKSWVICTSSKTS